jgi:hypothetical protein
MANNVLPNPLPVNISKNQLGFDAWGRAKAVTDHSVFHGMFTFDVPFEMWVEEIDTVEQATRTNFSSASGALLCVGVNGQTNYLYSKRNPRYQPNRGYLYSSSMIIDTAANAINHDFGSFTETSGLFFRVNAGLIYAVSRSTINNVTTENVELIAYQGDLTKGNVYDIQAQWRGVGNIKFFINLELVHSFDYLGTLTDLSVSNPAMPLAFSLNGTGSMRCGCVDLSSEGGKKDTRQLGFANSDEISLSAAEVPVLVLQLEKYVPYEGGMVRNTLDVALRRLSAFADDSSMFRVYYTRNLSKFTGTVWQAVDSGGVGQLKSIRPDIVIDNLLGMDLIESRRIPANDSIDVSNPDEQYGDYYLTGGDIILVTIEAKNQTLGGASLDWGTEI